MLGSRTIIVADDDEDIRECVASVLRDEGLDVRVAHHGRAALDLLDLLGDDHCVLLLDLMMPVMTGIEALESLRREGRIPALPVIVCSASKQCEAPPPGVRHVIKKPIDLDHLLALIAEASVWPASQARLRLESEVAPVARLPLSPSIIDAACAVLEGDQTLARAGVPHDARVHRLTTVRAVLSAWTEGKMTTEGAEGALQEVLRASS